MSTRASTVYARREGGAGTVEGEGEEVIMGKRYERLTTPLVRVDGELREASWDEALAAAADGFRRSTPQATGMFSCSKATNEMNYVAQKFARTVLHTNHVDSCNRT